MLETLLRHFRREQKPIHKPARSLDTEFTRMCGESLSEVCGEEYKKAQQGLLKTGLPWIELTPANKPNIIRFYNVQHKGFGDTARKPYVYEIDIECQRSKYSEYFTQKDAIQQLEQNGKRLLTASEIHSLVLTLKQIKELELQPSNLKSASAILRNHLQKRIVTQTSIDYDNLYIQQYCHNPEKQKTPFSTNETITLLTLLNGEPPTQDFNKTYNELIQVYKSILGVYPTYLWTPYFPYKSSKHLCRCGVDFGITIDCAAVFIDARDEHGWGHATGIRARSAKSYE